MTKLDKNSIDVNVRAALQEDVGPVGVQLRVDHQNAFAEPDEHAGEQDVRQNDAEGREASPARFVGRGVSPVADNDEQTLWHGGSGGVEEGRGVLLERQAIYAGAPAQETATEAWMAREGRVDVEALRIET